MFVLDEKEYGRKPIRLWVPEDTSGMPMGTYGGEHFDTPKPLIDENALDQMRNVAGLPFIHPHGVCAMPDVHHGVGATVGSVIATEKAIIPAAVGVDIGCGMMAVRLDGATANDVDEKKLKQIYSEIIHTVPTGFERHQPGTQNRTAANALWNSGNVIFFKHPDIMKRSKDDAYARMQSQFGSLGGGNHFIELCIDEKNELWVMLHSGSRGIGNLIGMYFIELAREDMRRHFINLPDRDLAYLAEGTEYFRDYVYAVEWAQEYAAANREEMMRRIMLVLHRHLPPFRERTEAINCHHNYVALESHYGRNAYVTRKGAIRARLGDLGIIPGSMGARSYIVRGKGSAESYHSCSHGAGRVMGRKEAVRSLTAASLEEAMQGIVWGETAEALDEHPAAYKNIDEVMAQQTDLVEVVHTLKQVLNVKGK